MNTERKRVSPDNHGIGPLDLQRGRMGMQEPAGEGNEQREITEAEVERVEQAWLAPIVRRRSQAWWRRALAQMGWR